MGTALDQLWLYDVATHTYFQPCIPFLILDPISSCLVDNIPEGASDKQFKIVHWNCYISSQQVHVGMDPQKAIIQHRNIFTPSLHFVQFFQPYVHILWVYS